MSAVRDIGCQLTMHFQVAVHFWAPWSAPCKQMDLVFTELAAQCPSAAFLRVCQTSQLPLVCKCDSGGITCSASQVEAEEIPDITERYTISMVPHFLLFKVLRLPLLLHGLAFHLILQKLPTHCHA